MKFVIAVSFLAIFILPPRVSASLGGDYTSVEQDRARMQASLQSTSKNSYAVHQLQSSTGVAVKEYVSPGGTVFGVSWKGPVPPGLQQILGTYYSQYQDAVKEQRARRRGHGPLLIQQPGLVVQSFGHMRSFSGRAYLPQVLPAGVTAQDIQ
jgi:hypothetical protein